MLNAKTMQAERYIYVSRPPDLRDRSRTLAPCRALEDPEVHELADQPKVEWSYLSTVSQEPRYHHTNWIPWKIWKSVYRIWGEASTSKSHKINKRQKKRRRYWIPQKLIQTRTQKSCTIWFESQCGLNFGLHFLKHNFTSASFRLPILSILGSGYHLHASIQSAPFALGKPSPAKWNCASFVQVHCIHRRNRWNQVMK